MWKRTSYLVAFVAFCASPTNAAPIPIPPVAEESGPTLPKPVALAIPVAVVNFPPLQAIAGTVSVVNLPAVQNVAGTVSVANLPVDAQGNLRVASTGQRSFKFIGITNATFVGNAGRAAMMAACHAEYPGSRMAFSDEYSATINPPPLTQTAWVQPRVAVALAIGGDSITKWFFDPNGNLFSGGTVNSLDCGSWQFADPGQGYSGAVLKPNGAVVSQGCNQTIAVACVAPE